MPWTPPLTIALGQLHPFHARYTKTYLKIYRETINKYVNMKFNSYYYNFSETSCLSHVNKHGYYNEQLLSLIFLSKPHTTSLNKCINNITCIVLVASITVIVHEIFSDCALRRILISRY